MNGTWKVLSLGFAVIAGLATCSSLTAQQQFEAEQARNQELYEQQVQRAQQGQSGQQSFEQQLAQQRMQQQLQQRQPVRPFPELEADHAQFIDRLLDYWQQTSGQVKQYTCDFQRWDYDPTYCNYRDPTDNRLAAYSIARGSVRYATPDKGMFETTTVWDFAKPPEQAGQQPEYKQREQKTNHEKWICDGSAIYEFDFENKVLYENEIPPEMQGNGLVNSPLPFLFGVDKEVLKERYWIRCVTPEGEDQNHWLEAWPKRIEDARNYQRIEIILSGEDFLPKMLHIYATNYDQAKNPMSRVFEFENRQVNSQLAKIQNFTGFFVRPQKPIGWRRVNRQALANQKMNEAPIVGQNPDVNLNKK